MFDTNNKKQDTPYNQQSHIQQKQQTGKSNQEQTVNSYTVPNTPQSKITTQLKNIQDNDSPQARITAQLQSIQDESFQGKMTTQLADKSLPENSNAEPAAKGTNQTGLPDKLKSGIETLSGYAMDDVKVHFNSSKPAQLQAHAYAQGTDIHIASGQEEHLPHEAWHVVQQKQGRVKPTKQMPKRSGLAINDDVILEKEADIMGAKAMQQDHQAIGGFHKTAVITNDPIQRVIDPNKLNLVGENHKESGDQRGEEEAFAESKFGRGHYWLEDQFTVENEQNQFESYGDPIHLRVLQRLVNAKLGLTDLVAKIESLGKSKPKKATNKEGESPFTIISTKILPKLLEVLEQAYGIAKDYRNVVAGITVPGTGVDMENFCLRLIKEVKWYQYYFDFEYVPNPKEKYHKQSFNSVKSSAKGLLKDMKKVKTPQAQFGFDLSKKTKIPILQEAYLQVSKDRSDVMHEAATKMKDKPGIWKVGQDHIDHILAKFDKNDLEYNIENKDDVNWKI